MAFTYLASDVVVNYEFLQAQQSSREHNTEAILFVKTLPTLRLGQL